MSLYAHDLEFADACLDAIDQAPEEPSIIKEALWRSAIIHFLKCFGTSARFQLVFNKVYNDRPPEARLAFDYFKDLRNKHLVHDENSYAQSIPGAILANRLKDYKIEKVVCFAATSMTLNQANFGNLKLLIGGAKNWVTREFDAICERFSASPEKESYAALLARDGISYTAPTVEDVSHARRI